MTTDPVARPAHYNRHPSGIECIDVIKHLPYELSSVIKYCWRWEGKNGAEDLRKALRCLEDCDGVTVGVVRGTTNGLVRAEIAQIVLRAEPEGTPLYEALRLLVSLQEPSGFLADPADVAWTDRLRAVINQRLMEIEHEQ